MIAPDLTIQHRGLRLTAAALTALDLCPTRGGDGIDTALRTRATTINSLWEAFEATRGRRGNALRTRLLVESRGEPWSFVERRTHSVLHEAGIEGWVANHPVLIGDSLFYVDVAFRGVKLALEIDGRFHEDDRRQFESDRWRQNALVLNGWTVLRFTWPMVRDHPQRSSTPSAPHSPPKTAHSIATASNLRARGARQGESTVPFSGIFSSALALRERGTGADTLGACPFVAVTVTPAD